MKNKRDFKQVPLRSWIWLAIYGVLILFATWWMENLWILIILGPIIFDICITHFVPWRWWEQHKSKALRSGMKLLEDIVVVLIAVYLINGFIFQNFKIPTSSLEKTCYVGDHLFVSKLAYGPRVPMTPIAFPIFHNAFPWGGKTYLEQPQLKYKRMKGFSKPKMGDLVVFNFPAGDTVTQKVVNPDYYTLVHKYGREQVWTDKATFGEVYYRPVDMRDHYIKRLVGMPGDSLQIVHNDLFINGLLQERPEYMQLNYFVQTGEQFLTSAELDELDITPSDVTLLSGDEPMYRPFFRYGLELDSLPQGGYGNVYHLPLTKAMQEQLTANPSVRKIVLEPSPEPESFTTYPLELETGWTRDNYGPIWIPKKGATIPLTPQNVALYSRCIRNYECHDLLVSAEDGKVYIDGAQTDTYTFEMDYYFMMGDNRHNSADSRAWGFVPEDHIVGKPLFITLSRGYERHRIRWERFFRVPK